jgi:folylpolyglutamate synthase
LTSLNTSAEAVDKLEVQKELAKVWESLDGGKSTVFATIEEAVNTVKKEAEDGPVDVFVVGSLHLIGGVLTVIE